MKTKIKNFLLFVSILLLTVLNCGCGEKKGEEEYRIPVTSSSLKYDTEAMIYTVDNEGILYTLSTYIINDDGTLTNIPPQIDMYDTEGELLGSYTMELSEGTGHVVANNAVADGEKLYALLRGSTRCVLYAYDIEQKTSEELYTFTCYRNINKMCLINGKIYFIGVDNTRVSRKSYAGNEDASDYAYGGEVFGYFDIATKEEWEIGIEFPVSMSKTPKDTVLVYSYSDEDGYHFVEYFPEDNTMEIVGRKNLTKDLVFEVCDTENHFIYTKLDRRNPGQIIMVGSVKEDEGDAEIAANGAIRMMGSKTWPIYAGGQVFYSDFDNAINRLSLDDCYTGSKTIKMLEVRYTAHYSPFSCGYTIEKETVDAEKLALKVLARDTDYNVCLLNSRDGASASIRKNGAYYPLNKLESVNEYLDSCFPYIKEAATAENGDIWMLPIDISLMGLIYDKELCEEMGVDIEKVTDLGEFVSLTKKLREENGGSAQISSYMLVEQFFAQYFAKYDTVETDLFRDMAELLKDIGGKSAWTADANLNNILLYGEENKSLYYDEYQNFYYILIADRIGEGIGYGACSYPTVSPDVLPQAHCIYLMVNPEAENLEDSLEFISAFAEHLLRQKDTCMLKDISAYTDTEFVEDVYKVFEDAQITFTMDYSLHMDGFERYMAGEITLDEFVADAERKLKMYLNE